jgi:elongation factor P
MINYSELEKGVRIIINNQPHEITEASPVFKGRGHSVIQAKLKNIITGDTLSKTFRPSDSFEEAKVEKMKAKFIYCHRGKYVFSEKDNPSKRFELTKEQIGNNSEFLKSNQIVDAITFEKEVVSISLPIKESFKVKMAPPGLKGNRSQSGTKVATIETGAKIDVPLFVETGDIIEINTETKEYTRRIEKK